MLNGGEVHVALPHSAFIIQHSALLFDFDVEHRRVVVFFERLVGIVLSGFAIVLEEDERHLLEGNGLSVFAVTLDVGFGEAFHVHHLQHHGKVEVDVEQLLLPLDADDRSGIELKVLDFDFFHLTNLLNHLAARQGAVFVLQKCEKNLVFEEFARKLHLFDVFFIILYNQ